MTCHISNASLQPPVYDVYTALLIRVIPNQHFKSTLLGGGGHKKEYVVYARENDDNYGRPLTQETFHTRVIVAHSCGSNWQLKLVNFRKFYCCPSSMGL